MTDEERKKRFETTAKLKVTKEEMSNVTGDAYNDVKYVFAPSIVKSIGGKNEDELFNLLDFWYEELRNNFGMNMFREQFAENIINYIELKKLHVSTEKVRELDLLLITSQQIEWINRWEREEGNYNTDSPIVKKALKNKRLRLLFQGDIGLLKEFIEELEKAAKVSKKAEVIVNYLSKEQYDIKNKKKELCALLNDIGFSLNYNTFKGAIWNAATEKGDKERESRRAAKQ